MIGGGVEPGDEGDVVQEEFPSVGAVGGHVVDAAVWRQWTRVRKVGLEPTRPEAQEPKSCVSANFTTPAGADSLLRRLWRSLWG